MESRFTKTDFKGWRYEKIIGLNEKTSVFNVYPRLQMYPEFHEQNHKDLKLAFDKVLRFGLIMYSDTVINRTIPELANRKKEAALLAGFKPNIATGQFMSSIEEMLLGNSKSINKIFVRILRITRSNKFQELGVLNEARAKGMEKLVNGEGNTKTEFETLKQISAYIEELEKDILNDDFEGDLLEEMYSEIDSENLGIRPEEIAKLKRDGKFDTLIKSPYK